MSDILASIFRMGDQVKRNLRDFAGNPGDYLDNVVHQNNIEWKKNPDERSMGFFNPVPLGTMGNFVLKKQIEEAITNLSRRDFLKKSAGIAGGSAAASIPGAKLLQKFAPEERALAKEAAIETAPKYKYNSLKEYLDDVETSAYSAHDNPIDYQMFGEDASSIPNLMRERLLRDEARYKEHNNLSKGVQFTEEGQPVLIFDEKVIRRPLSWDEISNANKTIMEFSPQAKKEMKEIKERTMKLHTDYGGNPYESPWVDWIVNEGQDVEGLLNGLRTLK